MNRIYKSAAVSALVIATIAGPSFAEEVPAVAAGTLVEQLRAGGYVLYIRHARTETDYADQLAAVLGRCDTQRMLSEAGWREARTIGAAFSVHRIPVAAVFSSEYCRAWQTAEIAFGRHLKRTELNFEPAEEYTDQQTAAMHDRVAPLLAATPPAGFNTVIVAHDDPFEAATGHYPEPQGVTIVVKPEGNGKFQLVGRIAPDGWFGPLPR